MGKFELPYKKFGLLFIPTSGHTGERDICDVPTNLSSELHPTCENQWSMDSWWDPFFVIMQSLERKRTRDDDERQMQFFEYV